MAHSHSVRSSTGWGWPPVVGVPANLQLVVSALHQTRDYITKAMAGIDAETLWRRPRPSLSAPGNLLLHLAGTEHQWIGEKIGGHPLRRDRDFEFAADVSADITLAECERRLRATWAESDAVLAALSETQATERVLFCLHYTENHLSYHCGQLVLVVRLARADFRLY